MRKTDYALLARCIADERSIAQRHVHDQLDRELVLGALEGVARGFAAGAHVDRAAFLLACGLQP
jgi:hypothetical protein